MIADRNLLSGLLGLQNGFIDQVNLVVAFPTWMLDKSAATRRTSWWGAAP